MTSNKRILQERHSDLVNMTVRGRIMIEKIIAEQLKIDVGTVTDDKNLIEDLGADSLNVVELVMAFETEYDIQITDEDAENIITVADAKRYIEEYS